MQVEKKKALLTGATGFIGSHLAARLLDEGWSVHCLVRKSTHVDLLPPGIRERIHFHKLEDANANLHEIMARVSPQVVFHLASLFLARHQAEDIPALIGSNVTFGAQLVEAMTCQGIHCLVNTGTSWQHYQDAAYDPVCLYAATKEAFRALLEYYRQTTPLRMITLKLFDTYGAHDHRPKLFALLKRIAATGESLAMSPGEQLIDMVHVDDVVRAFLLAAEYLQTNQQEYFGDYAVSSGQPCKLKDFVALYERVARCKLAIHWGKRPYRPREVMLPWSTGKNLPGWSPEISLEDGIRKIIFEEKTDA